MRGRSRRFVAVKYSILTIWVIQFIISFSSTRHMIRDHQGTSNATVIAHNSTATPSISPVPPTPAPIHDGNSTSQPGPLNPDSRRSSDVAVAAVVVVLMVLTFAGMIGICYESHCLTLTLGAIQTIGIIAFFIMGRVGGLHYVPGKLIVDIMSTILIYYFAVLIKTEDARSRGML